MLEEEESGRFQLVPSSFESPPFRLDKGIKGGGGEGIVRGSNRSTVQQNEWNESLCTVTTGEESWNLSQDCRITGSLSPLPTSPSFREN